MNKLVRFGTGIALSTFTILSVNAHESRDVGEGEYKMVVGLKNEPAFEDIPNALDLFIYYNNGDYEAINAEEGDEVDLTVEALVLKNGRVKRRVELRDGLVQDWEDPSNYTAWFKPIADGAYGFHIYGEINGVEIDEEFICGEGSLDSESSFDCVVDPQTVPNTGKKDESGYKDTDSYSVGNNHEEDDEDHNVDDPWHRHLRHRRGLDW
jgi:hypothetical protein